MARVTRARGVVAACVWDHGGGQGPLSVFWEAARELDPASTTSRSSPARARGTSRELFRAAGLDDVEETALPVSVEHPSFEDWWEPYTLGVAARGRLRSRPRLGAAGGVARTVPGEAAGRTVRADGPSLGCPRPRLAIPSNGDVGRRCCVRCGEGAAQCGPREKGHRQMRYRDSRASALWGRGDGRWRRIVA